MCVFLISSNAHKVLCSYKVSCVCVKQRVTTECMCVCEAKSHNRMYVCVCEGEGLEFIASALMLTNASGTLSLSLLSNDCEIFF